MNARSNRAQQCRVARYRCAKPDWVALSGFLVLASPFLTVRYLYVPNKVKSLSEVLGNFWEILGGVQPQRLMHHNS
jgi:hypothetical protein